MCEGLIVIVSFFSGLFVALIIYNIIAMLVGAEDKLVVFKSSKKTKKERIVDLEYQVADLQNKLRRIDYPLLISVQQYEYSRRMAERNKRK